MDQRLLDARKRLREDYRLYSRNALKIRTKEGDIRPLILNNAQEVLQNAIDDEMATRGYARIIILKARQQGLSTHVGGYLYYRVSQNKARKAMVITHHADSTRALFDMTKRYHDKCPEILKPSTKYSSRRELSFDVLDSSYVVATAGGDNIARGETLSDVHISELAFWAPSTAEKNLNGLLQAVPATPGTSVFIESTANGFNLFHELWKGAVDGTNGFRPVFIPWFLDPSYREQAPENFTPTPAEEELIAKYTLDYDQLQWRRTRIARSGEDLFMQEYPAEPEEAFLTTGRPVFNPEQVYEMLKTAPKTPLRKLALEGDEWHPHVVGEHWVYKEHDPKETYYIGADVSLGVRGGDWSVAQVFDSDREQVAIYRRQTDPDNFAYVLDALGKYYNMARIIVENNNHGILTCQRLGKDLQYPNMYYVMEVDKVTERESTTYGFRTDVKTKPLIIDQLRANLREGKIKLNDHMTLKEMLTYIVTESGTMEAEHNCFDDCVMSLAMVNWIHEGKFTPIESTNEWYIEAI